MITRGASFLENEFCTYDMITLLAININVNTLVRI